VILSLDFIGPSEQISLIPAQLETESFLDIQWLHIPCEHGQNCGQIEEVSESTFRISVFVRLDGSPLNYYFEYLSSVFPGLLITGSSYCPHMGDLNLESWFGGQPILSVYLPLFNYRQEFIRDVSILEDSILTDLEESMNDVLTAAEASFASGCKTPRKAFRKLQIMNSHWDSYKVPNPDVLKTLR
jgi:hypothetical protein